jgi:DNA-binding response OmpR family regulator
LGYAKMGSFGRLSGRSILVVEDEPLIAIGLKVLLEDEGAGVEIASNPRDALRLADETHFSAAILDFGSAGSESAPLCRALKAYAIPFMFYTGYHDVHESSSGPPIVTKPASSEKLIATIAGLLDPPLHPASPSIAIEVV